MKSITTLSLSALLLAGVGFALPTKVLAHGNDNQRASHVQQSQVHQVRHGAGISRQQDRQIHRQDRRDHRVDHQLRNGVNSSWNGGYYQNGNWRNSLNSQLGTGGYPAGQYNAGLVAPYYGQYGTSAGANGYLYPSTQTVQNGHFYSADGHRFDHHGNHDDGPGDF